ncbi:TPR domain-containing glycosyltransferase [Desulfofalx alkaliphila]|uniref:tetratricopeptide repeat-containing glycosyltransferase family 2 protein n=1 Tax=Desulfofalx alkaliphila TaxID=105483 RepID=UPI00146F966C|nr:TPR domain-containing glycosyltransferase [Desulfofalx alkaliphila]
MIVKDEGKFLGRCLESVRDCVDEIIIVDTGSKDNTVSIAKKFGAKVYHYKWNDNFSAARNFSLTKATGQWILYLDADEELEANCGKDLRKLCQNNRYEGYFFQINNLTDNQDTIRHINVRMFKNNPLYRFTGALHEQIIDAIIENSGKKVPLANSGINIFHYGYLQTVFQEKDKAVRNYRINKKMVEQYASDPYYLYTLGNACVSLDNFSEAAEHYSRAIQLVNPKAHYAPSLFNAYSSCLLKLGRLDQALSVIKGCKTLYPDYTDIYFLEGNLHSQMGNNHQACHCFEQCLQLGEQCRGKYTTRTGVGSHLPLLKLANIYASTGEIEKSVIYQLLAAQLKEGQGPDYPLSTIRSLANDQLLRLAVKISLREMKKGKIKAEYYLVLGKYFYLHGDLDTCQQMIHKALRLNDNIPWARQLLQDIYRQEAAAVIKDALKAYPHSPEINKYKDLLKKGGK